MIILHQENISHLVGIDEAVEDKELVHELIDNCWVQEQWSASITLGGLLQLH